jgi:hypothetical protein
MTGPGFIIPRFFPPDFPSLAFVSRKVHSETVSIFYSRNIFKVSNGLCPEPNLKGLQALLFHTPPQYLSQIRRVRFVVWASCATKDVSDNTISITAHEKDEDFNACLKTLAKRLKEPNFDFGFLRLRASVIRSPFMTPRYIRHSLRELDADSKGFIEMLLQIGTERAFRLDELARFAEGSVGKFAKFKEKVLSDRSGLPRLLLVLNVRTSREKPGLFEACRTMGV